MRQQLFAILLCLPLACFAGNPRHCSSRVNNQQALLNSVLNNQLLKNQLGTQQYRRAAYPIGSGYQNLETQHTGNIRIDVYHHGSGGTAQTQPIQPLNNQLQPAPPAPQREPMLQMLENAGCTSCHRPGNTDTAGLDFTNKNIVRVKSCDIFWSISYRPTTEDGFPSKMVQQLNAMTIDQLNIAGQYHRDKLRRN